MTSPRTICVLAAALLLGGCGDWWGRERDIPVTAPQESAELPPEMLADAPPADGTPAPRDERPPAAAPERAQPDAGRERRPPAPPAEDESRSVVPAPAAAVESESPATRPAPVPSPGTAPTRSLSDAIPLTDLAGDPPKDGESATRPSAVFLPSEPAAEVGPDEPAEPVLITGSMMRVNDQFVSVDEILSALAPQLQALPPGLSELEFRRRAAEIIQRQIGAIAARSLVLAEAEQFLNDQQKQMLQKEVDDFERRLLAEAGGSRTRLRRQIARRGGTLEEVLQEQRRQLMIQVYLQSKFMPAIQVTRKMLWDYYRQHREEYETPKRVQVQIIALPVDAFLETADPDRDEREAARQAARKVAEQAEERLERGEDFSAVAKDISRGPRARFGGIWPLMAAGNLRQKEVEQRAFQLPEGQRSGIIETDEGFYIVRAAAVEPPEVVSFEQAQGEIRRLLRDRRYGRLVDDYFQRLMETATIEQSAQFGQLVLERAWEEYRIRQERGV